MHLEVTLQNVKQPNSGRNSGHVRNSGIYGINCALLWQKRKYIKSKTTSTLKVKQSSIATVRDILKTFATFPAPLLPHYRLPFKYFNPKIVSLSSGKYDRDVHPRSRFRISILIFYSSQS
jgi:hypothetical protein